MKISILFLALLCATLVSCTKEKTDYEAELADEVTEYFEFKEAAVLTNDGYTISLEALNGTLFKGYNEIRVKITNAQGSVNGTLAVTFLPLLSANGSEGRTSCPHRHHLTYDEAGGYYSGYVVFTEESTNANNWVLQIGLSNGGQHYAAQQDIVVQSQPNKNLSMTSFTGSDGIDYIIALAAPQKPKVAENNLLAGIYRRNDASTQSEKIVDNDGLDVTSLTYSEVNAYTLQLDPRMPEPSMGNHSSPNNRDLTQQADGLYNGVVNYTMTGNWTLNFILLNQNGQIVKGTVVPDDFTPGVEGVKSELYIDILF